MSRCWNCGSPEYINVVAVEECPSCGIKCDYHGSGANQAYDRAMEKTRTDNDDA